MGLNECGWHRNLAASLTCAIAGKNTRTEENVNYEEGNSVYFHFRDRNFIVKDKTKVCMLSHFHMTNRFYLLNTNTGRISL